MFDDQSIALKVNKDNADSADEGFSDETSELNEQKV